MIAAVLDSSAAIALLADGGTDAAVIRSASLYAPEIIDLEFTNVIRKLELRDELNSPNAARLVHDWGTNRVVRCRHAGFLPRIWQLRGHITPYDAAYVALAEHLNLPLVTADRRLAKAAARFCEVVTLGA